MEELCAQCCMLVEFIICFRMCIGRNIVHLCIQKICPATDEKICSVNLDRESTFLMLHGVHDSESTVMSEVGGKNPVSVAERVRHNV